MDKVDSQTSQNGRFASYASETRIPKEDDIASTKEIIIMPAITTVFECVETYKPIIKPKVVSTLDVKPKLNPFFTDVLIGSLGSYK